MKFLKDGSKILLNLPRFAKRTIAVIIDIGLCILCTWLAFYLRLEQFIKLDDVTILAVLISIFLAIPIFFLSDLYKTMFRFPGPSIVLSVAVATFAYGLMYFAVIGIYVIPGIPRSIGIIQPVLLFLGITSSRVFIKFLYNNSSNSRNFKNKKNVIIYGAGSAGRQLLASLENSPEMKVIGFLDDNYQFHNQIILGQNVYNPSKIEALINGKNIDLILLALPSIDRKKRNEIIESINKFKVKVKTLPSIQDIVSGKISVVDIKDLTIEDLLNREQVEPDLKLLSENISSKVVLVTGAGGSIGSELCRQITKLNPKKLLLIESNEFAIYKISEELKKLSPNINIIPLLLNIQNLSRVNEVFKIFKIDTVYHAAAYKHVPLVEENICESVRNNVFGTFSLTKIAIKYDVHNFVLISTDKAVRPTNIMGASKRLAEICIQALYNNQNNNQKINTKFAIVRFGNVLESSGSVIPKFKKQIEEGGPVTLTHLEVTRYFMTLTEASQLVIQAGAMSSSCEVFVLDMGKSIKIKDLILKMIKLSGLTIKNSENLEGDIEIKTIGLRSGEKLYEELLIGDNPQKTAHKKIQKSQDPFIPFDELKKILETLDSLIENNEVEDVKEMISQTLPSFKSNSKIVDHFYEEKFKSINKKILYPILNDNENNVIKIKKK